MILIDGERKTDLPKLKRPAVFKLNHKYRGINNAMSPAEETIVRHKGFPTFCHIDDPEKGGVEMRYTKSVQPKQEKGGGTIPIYTPTRIEFLMGFIVVLPNQPDLYYFLKNSPWFSEDESKNSFYEVNKSKDADKNVSKVISTFNAQQYVLGDKALDPKEKKRVAVALGALGVDQMGPSEIDNYLLGFIDQDANKFLEEVQSKKLDVKVLVNEANNYGIIKYNGREWGWVDDEGKFSTIVAVPRGMDSLPMDWFIEWLLDTDNTGVLQEIEKRVASDDSTEPVESENQESGDDELETLRARGKELGIPYAHVMGEAKLRDAITLKEESLVQAEA